MSTKFYTIPHFEIVIDGDLVGLEVQCPDVPTPPEAASLEPEGSKECYLRDAVEGGDPRESVISLITKFAPLIADAAIAHAKERS